MSYPPTINPSEIKRVIEKQVADSLRLSIEFGKTQNEFSLDECIEIARKFYFIITDYEPTF
jgi:hypothetical protein